MFFKFLQIFNKYWFFYIFKHPFHKICSSLLEDFPISTFLRFWIEHIMGLESALILDYFEFEFFELGSTRI
ncbi:hypothetical protein V6Z11_A07G180400 [Gossypium hirsutum]